VGDAAPIVRALDHENKLLHEVLLVTKGRRLVLGVHMYAG
jgi:hypothetical protein